MVMCNAKIGLHTPPTASSRDQEPPGAPQFRPRAWWEEEYEPEPELPTFGERAFDDDPNDFLLVRDDLDRAFDL